MARVASSAASSRSRSARRTTRLSSFVRTVGFTANERPSLQLEEAGDDLGERTLLGPGGLVQRLSGSVHQLVDQALRERIEHFRRILAARQHAQRAIELLAARLVGAAAQGADESDALPHLNPVHELPD